MLLDQLPIFWVFATTVSLLVLSAAAGTLVGRARRRSGAGDASDTDVVLGAVFGLLGLVLAFTFGIAEERFSRRRALVLEEANAIETAYLRASAVPGEESQRLRRLLRDYTVLRAQSVTPSTLAQGIEDSERLHAAMWKQARAIALAAPDSEAMALLLEGLNEVIEMHEARVATVLYQRLSTILLVSLYGLSMLSMACLGHKGGLSESRTGFSTTALALAISTVLLLIVDLERPWQDLFDVSHKALRDVQRSMLHEP
jgi:hypothetical protein